MHKEKKIVDKLIQKYKTANPFEICDKMNINVSYKQLGNLRGFYRYSKRNQFITLNINLNNLDKIVACAHELGHSIMHPDMNRIFLNSTMFVSSKYEHEANRFAAYLLLTYYGKLGIENIPSHYLDLIK